MRLALMACHQLNSRLPNLITTLYPIRRATIDLRRRPPRACSLPRCIKVRLSSSCNLRKRPTMRYHLSLWTLWKPRRSKQRMTMGLLKDWRLCQLDQDFTQLNEPPRRTFWRILTWRSRTFMLSSSEGLMWPKKLLQSHPHCLLWREPANEPISALV